jgi:hypothetical protein
VTIDIFSGEREGSADDVYIGGLIGVMYLFLIVLESGMRLTFWIISSRDCCMMDYRKVVSAVSVSSSFYVSAVFPVKGRNKLADIRKLLTD